MSFEVESQIIGKLAKNFVQILDQSMQNELLSKGYGEKYEKKFILNSFETLYLSYIKKLKVSKVKKNISFDDLIQIFQQFHTRESMRSVLLFIATRAHSLLPNSCKFI